MANFRGGRGGVNLQNLFVNSAVQLFIVCLLSACLVHCAGREVNLDFDSDDTVVIEAARETPTLIGGKSRVKRQQHLRPSEQHSFRPMGLRPPTPAFSPFESVVVDNPISVPAPTPCMTTKGEMGRCVSLKQCYTALQGSDIDNNGMYGRNNELANMLRAASGSCEVLRSVHPHSYPYRKPSMPSVSRGNGDPVCCSGEYMDKTGEDSEPLPLPGHFIVGGKEASKGQFPFIVALMNNGVQFCGGSLINSNHVLTAAHCIAHMGPQEIAKVTVQAGDHDIYSKSDGTHQTRKVSKVIKHKKYNKHTQFNDIAILKLSTPVTTSSGVKPVCLAASTGKSAFVSGWGRLSLSNSKQPSTLQFTGVTLWTNAQCSRTYGESAPGGIADHMLCAGGTTDACMGDSGGPLTVGGCQVGIVSWGVGCGSYPGVYTRVSSFTSWIQKNQRL